MGAGERPQSHRDDINISFQSDAIPVDGRQPADTIQPSSPHSFIGPAPLHHKRQQNIMSDKSWIFVIVKKRSLTTFPERYLAQNIYFYSGNILTLTVNYSLGQGIREEN